MFILEDLKKREKIWKSFYRQKIWYVTTDMHLIDF
jgi:hypothetical protein